MKKSIYLLVLVIMLCLMLTGCVAAKEQVIDVDLTALSSTMRSAEIYNMQARPAGYVGKTVKMRGNYFSSYSEEKDTQYHFVLIPDAAACCQQGMEFIWTGEHTYPDDYPEINQYIEVIGVYDVYEEDGNFFYYVATEGITTPSGD